MNAPNPTQESDQSLTDSHAQSSKVSRSILRWSIPPGVSLLMHGGLIGSVAWIGMQISAQTESNESVSIVKLALPDQPINNEPAARPSPLNTPSAQPNQHTQNAIEPSSLDQSAKQLGSFAYTKPTMDPVTIASTQSDRAQMIKPESAAPPTVQFAGVQSKAARKIVYIIDGSGATANSFGYLQTQLLRSIDRLSPTQLFQVIIFRKFDDQTVLSAPINSGRLARATRSNKQVVSDWLNTIVARGRSNPLDGLRASLAFGPDLTLLITRSIQRTEMGWAQGQQQILSELNTLNPADPRTGKRQTRIQTIQLLDEDPTGIMRAIGTLHGDQGSDAKHNYRVITYDDLITPDEDTDLSTRSLSATNEQRIIASGEIMGSLMSSGTNLSVLYTYADDEQRAQSKLATKQIRSLVGTLVRVDGRAGLLDAQTTMLDAITHPNQSTHGRIRESIRALNDVLYNDPDVDAQRVLMLARGHELLGERKQAIEHINQLSEIAYELELTSTIKAQLLIARIGLNLEPRIFESSYRSLFQSNPFVTPSGGIDGIWGLLIRESITKARFANNHVDPWDPMIELRIAAARNPGVRNFIDSRIELILSQTIPNIDQNHQSGGSQTIPIEILLAAANVRSHSIETREQAMDLYEHIATKTQLNEQSVNEQDQIIDALWQIGVLGRAINTRATIERSTNALTRLAQNYPDSQRAQDAIIGAINSTPSTNSSLKIERLTLGIEMFPEHNQSDLWRLSLAELLEDFARLQVLDELESQTREGVLGAQLYEQTVLDMLDRYTDPVLRAGLCRRMSIIANTHGLASSSLWTKRVAINEMQADPKGSINKLDALIALAKSKNESSDELELLRAQTLLELGQSQIAFQSLLELSTRIDASGIHTSTYWQAWSMMLETIAQSGQPRDKDQAIVHIARLELIDQNLGGSPWEQRIMSVRKTLHSSP